MDGFAVRWQDVAASRPEKPVSLEIVGEVPAGTVSKTSVAKGQAIKIMTGAPVPRGADTIVRVEYTKTCDGRVEVCRTDGQGAHIRKPGEDIARGQSVIENG